MRYVYTFYFWFSGDACRFVSFLGRSGFSCFSPVLSARSEAFCPFAFKVVLQVDQLLSWDMERRLIRLQVAELAFVDRKK